MENKPKKNVNKNKSVSNVRLVLITAGSFLMYFCSWGLAQSFGIMYIELLDRFGGSKGETTWVQSLFSGILLATGPITGLLLKNYGCRIVGLCGSLCLTAGLVASVFTPSLYVLYFTYGVIGGFGGSLLFTTAGVVILQHFDKRRSLVIGISEAGASTGTLVIPLLTQACLDEYGFRGTFLLLGGLCLQCVVAALIFVPPPLQIEEAVIIVKKDTNHEEQFKPPLNKTENTFEEYLQKDIANGFNQENTIYTISVNEETATADTTTMPPENTLKRVFGFFNPGYLTFAASWAIMMLPFLVPFLFLPDAALSRGISRQNAAYIASAIGVGSIAGKAGFGFLGDVKSLETSIVHIVPIMIFGTLTLIYNFVSGLASLMILAACIGITSAIFDGIHPVLTLQLVGPEHLSVGLGMLYFLMSITTILGTPIAGWIADATDRYDETFYYCAGLSYLAALLAIYIPIWKKRQKSKTESSSF